MTVTAHISDQLKYCETRLSLIKTNSLELRRAKRDLTELESLKTILAALEGSDLKQLNDLSTQLSEQHDKYDKSYLPSLVSRCRQLQDSCQSSQQKIEKFLNLHRQIYSHVQAAEQQTQQTSDWVSSNQRFSEVNEMSATINQIEVGVYYC